MAEAFQSLLPYEKYCETFARVAQLSEDIALVKQSLKGEDDGDSDSP